MNNISGNSVKFAVSNKLRNSFPNIKIYTGVVAKANYPCFVISQIDVSINKTSRNCFKLDFLIGVAYYHTKDYLNDKSGKLETVLDNIGFDLMFKLDSIDVFSKHKRALNAQYEKVDGTVQYFATYSLMLLTEQLEKNKMNTIKRKVKVI